MAKNLCLKIESILEYIDELEGRIDAHVGLFEGGFQCLSCPYFTPIKATLRSHIEAKHVNTGGFCCDSCPKICPTRHALKMHKLRIHKF